MAVNDHMALARIESLRNLFMPRHRPRFSSSESHAVCPFRLKDIHLSPLTSERITRIFDRFGPGGVYWALCDSLDQPNSTRNFPFIESRTELDTKTALWLKGAVAVSETTSQYYENDQGRKIKETTHFAHVDTKLGGIVVFTNPYTLEIEKRIPETPLEKRKFRPYVIKRPINFRNWGSDWARVDHNGFDPHEQEQTLLVFYNDRMDELYLIHNARFWRGSSPPPDFQFTAPIAAVCFESGTPFSQDKLPDLDKILHFIEVAKNSP